MQHGDFGINELMRTSVKKLNSARKEAISGVNTVFLDEILKKLKI